MGTMTLLVATLVLWCSGLAIGQALHRRDVERFYRTRRRARRHR